MLFFGIVTIALFTFITMNNINFNPTYTIIIIVVSLVFIFKPIFIIPILFTSSLLGEYFFVAFSGNGWDIEFSLIFIIGSILYLIFFKSKFPKISLRFILLAAFFIVLNVFNFISARYSVVGQYSTSVDAFNSAIIMGINTLVIFFMSLEDDDNVARIIQIIKICMTIFIIYIVYSLYNGQAYFQIAKDQYINGIFLNQIGDAILAGHRFSLGATVGVNLLGTSLALIAGFFLALFLMEKNILVKIYDLLFSIICLCILFITGSRSASIGFLAGFAITAVLYIIVSFIVTVYRKQFIRFIIYFIILATAAILAYVGYLHFDAIREYVYNNFILKYISKDLIDKYLNSAFINRFFDINAFEEGAAGRVAIWNALIQNVIPQNLKFGLGLSGYSVPYTIYQYIGQLDDAHNIFLSALAQTGIVGTVLYIGFFLYFEIRMIIALFKNKFFVIPIMLTMIAFINGMGEDYLISRFLWIAIGIGFMMLAQLKSSSYDDKKQPKKEIKKVVPIRADENPQIAVNTQVDDSLSDTASIPIDDIIKEEENDSIK